jgi:hypothetical protein
VGRVVAEWAAVTLTCADALRLPQVMFRRNDPHRSPEDMCPMGEIRMLTPLTSPFEARGFGTDAFSTREQLFVSRYATHDPKAAI